MKNKRICITGGDGFLGRHVTRQLALSGYKNIFVARREDYDLREMRDIKRMLDLDSRHRYPFSGECGRYRI